MTAYLSSDRHWRVIPVTLDGTPLLRVLHDQVQGTPVHRVDNKRTGTVRMAGGWFWAGDARTPAEVNQLVPLAELTEER